MNHEDDDLLDIFMDLVDQLGHLANVLLLKDQVVHAAQEVLAAEAVGPVVPEEERNGVKVLVKVHLLKLYSPAHVIKLLVSEEKKAVLADRVQLFEDAHGWQLLAAHDLGHGGLLDSPVEAIIKYK